MKIELELRRLPSRGRQCRRASLGLRSLLGIGLLAALPSVASAAQAVPDPAPDQVAQYKAAVPKSIIELQQFRTSTTLPIERGGHPGTATLIDLNPTVNAAFLLTLDWGKGARAAYHLENPDPRGQTLRFAEGTPAGLAITAKGATTTCQLWAGDPSPLEAARRSSLPFAPLCDGHLYLRNQVEGSRTELETVTDFLRDNVWGGEKIIGIVKDQLYSDAFVEKGTLGKADQANGATSPDAPRPADVAPNLAGRTSAPEHLGIGIAGATKGQLGIGRWYQVANLQGVYVSTIEPDQVAQQILDSHRDRVSGLDAVEGAALDYLIAFDLSAFDVGFAMGTEHPRVDWSVRVNDSVRNDALPGPDGIGTTAPLVTTGMVSPALTNATVAVFTGGYRRSHGAFRYGDFATRNYGTHYGFLEQGVVYSKLQPGLATLYVLDDGTIDMRTWTAADEALLPRVRFARQNGVPLVETDPASHASVPGPLVAKWGPGNWSGSAEKNLRSIRAGICLQDTGTKRFLIYGYFSTATPSAMARVFQAYGCGYAMLLDMNALEHTYLALYVHKAGGGLVVQHLVEGMAALDKESGNQLVTRFLGYPDNRDFFYLTRREAAK